MSFRAKRELLVQVAPRYRAARHGGRSAILDEFIAVTGYDRKMARLFRQADRGGCELLMAVRFVGGGYDLVLPEQTVAPFAVEYTAVEDLVLQVHSGRNGAARFSDTDDRDEQRLRLYGVVGKLDELRPAVNLRAGAYGHFKPVPVSTVFAGDECLVTDLNAGA
jgi:hypothetical protein